MESNTFTLHHTATNGLAERFVQTFKHALKASRSKAPVQQCLDLFLLTYRNTPHATMKETPAMLFLGHRLQQLHRQQHAKDRRFVIG